jgi:hypothetical protein
MGGNTKGKGKQETWEEAEKRIDLKRAAAERARKKAADYADRVDKEHDRHLDKADQWTESDRRQEKGAGKGKGSGKRSSVVAKEKEIARLKKENDELKGKRSRGRSTTPQRRRTRSQSRARTASASSAGSTASRRRRRSKSAGQGDAPGDDADGDYQKSAAAKRKAKREERKEKQRADKAKEEKPAEGEARQTRMCYGCTYESTYATSVKCWRCKAPFGAVAPIVDAPAAVVKPPVVLSPTLTAAANTLQAMSKAAEAQAASFSEAAKKAVSFAAANGKAPPPTPPAATPTPATEQVKSADAPAAVVAMDTSEPSSGDVTSAKLVSLRKTKAQFQTQIAALAAEEVGLLAAFNLRITEIDAQVKVLLEARQQELAPHQLGQFLALRQQELSQAQKVATDLENARSAALDAFDARVEVVTKQFVDQAAALEKAKTTVELGLKEERQTMIAEGNREIEAAQLAVSTAQEAVTSVQLAHSAKCCSPAAEVPAIDVAATHLVADAAAEHNAAQVQHLKVKEATINTQAAQNAMLMQQLAEAQEQLAALKLPKVVTAADLKDPINLVPPQPPSTEEARNVLWVIGQSLRLFAQQDNPVPVTWADLTNAGLDWVSFQLLIPVAVVAKSVVGACGTGKAPDQTQVIPRKILELLRSQLDVLAAQNSVEQAAAAQTKELSSKVAEWTTSVIDQAKRISERKRIPAVTAEDLNDPKNVPLPPHSSNEVL